jgi:hypothetical protein
MAGEPLGEAHIDLKIAGDVEKQVREMYERAAREAAKRAIPMPVRPQLAWNAWAGSQAGQAPVPRSPLAQLRATVGGTSAMGARDDRQIGLMTPNPAAMVNAGLSGSVSGVVSALGPLGVAATVAAASLTSLAATASPNSFSTFRTSLDILAATIGGKLVPVMDSASRAIQNFAAMLDAQSGRRGYTADREGEFQRMRDQGHLTYFFREMLASSFIPGHAGVTASNALNLAPDNWFRRMSNAGGPFLWALKGGADAASDAMGGGSLKRSQAGMPQPQYSSFEEYIDRLDIAGLKSDTAEGILLQKQLENTEGINANTKETADLLRAMKTWFDSNPLSFRN